MYCHAYKVIREATSGYYGQAEVEITCDLPGEHQGDHFDETVGVYWRLAN